MKEFPVASRFKISSDVGAHRYVGHGIPSDLQRRARRAVNAARNQAKKMGVSVAQRAQSDVGRFPVICYSGMADWIVDSTVLIRLDVIDQVFWVDASQLYGSTTNDRGFNTLEEAIACMNLHTATRQKS